ncbi:Hypothetical predicted protein [Pelobates cultripes]|uniref:DUF4585 domain-containing protein n=1 Tax=Pelobates cultripes TaxID=61616 RepID=A0AAD1T8M9_PELCU|nr:Hypothetical predicted protein [Pelobates cultripes]
MLRYKKHKRLADGLGTSGVGVMDDTDREVSSFTDRAFRSLSVAEEEPFNDVPHIPSPIRGMPLSTKYHLGIFNLSVRKTQPLAQLPTLPGQRGKWAPTFQPLLNSARHGIIDGKTNFNKIYAPEPRGYRQQSKVSSLIKTFDNIENEIPGSPSELSGLPLSVTSQREKIPEEALLVNTVSEVSTEIKLPECSNQGSLAQNEILNLHRRTAREVFLESQAERSSRISGSPSSLGSPPGDSTKKLAKQKESLRKTSFLHSENSAFKSWSDINKRIGGDESENSFTGTSPVLRCATPCSPLLSRTKCGIRAREAGMEVGWASPASSVSSSYDPVQMLRSVPPLPTKKGGRQPKEHRPRPGAPRIPVDVRIQEDEMQVDVSSPLSKDNLDSTRILKGIKKSKSPQGASQKTISIEETEIVLSAPHSHTVIKEQVDEKMISPQQAKKPEVKNKYTEDNLVKEHLPSPGRIKTLIQQMEKETIKDVVAPWLLESENKIKELPKEDTAVTKPAVTATAPPTSNLPPHSSVHIPPWRRSKISHKMEVEEKIISGDMAPNHENKPSNKEEVPLEKTVGSFNITSLLTPVIRRKNIKDALEEHPMVTTPPPAETITTKEQDSRDINVNSNRDDYKSKATSLLFNLKDMRKRVKSTYSPATSLRTGNDNHSGEIKAQGQSNHRIALMDISKWVMDKENNTHSPVIHSPRATGGSESKSSLLASTADNYLSLSSPQQAMECTVTENRDAILESIQTEANTPDENIRHHHTEYNIRKGADYPSLNLYPKENKSPELHAKENRANTPVQVNIDDEQHLPEEDNTEETELSMILNEDIELPAIHGTIISESDIGENIPPCQVQSSPCEELEIQQISESGDGEIRVESQDDIKDELQYYAVSSCVIDESGQSGGIESKTEKAELKEMKESEKQIEETACVEEIERPSSITMFKPNLFRIKDNTIKSSPVTKSVRLPLLRSMSEDSLAYRKEVVSQSEDKAEVCEAKQKLLEDKVINSCTAINDFAEEMEMSRRGKIHELLNMRPSSEIPKAISIHHHTKKQKEEESLDLWKELSLLNEEWRKTEARKSEAAKVIENVHEGPFFHPVETCISEVTGPSPECNTLLMHNGSESLTDLVNGELASPLLLNANTNYPTFDSNLIHNEDAVTLLEDIACSTITSPMSESVTCSMVASPMSMNSSGFTTALSGFEDYPSPTSSSISSRNGKFIFPPLEKTIPALPGIIENDKTEDSINLKEQVQSMEPLNIHTGKPPAVPPKTEKALRRAKRLTKKRRKTDVLQKTQDGELIEPDLILDVPSPGNLTPNSLTLQSHHKLAPCIPKVLQPEGSISASSTPSFPVTQRKLLQDPDSGQYFVVDIPVHFRVKTFYDPETGKYLQVSLPPSERETPTIEALNNQFILYPGLPPVPISSISSLKDLSQHLDHGDPEKGEQTQSWEERHEEDEYPKERQYIESICDSCDQSMTGTPQSMERFGSRSRSPDIISIKDLDDFAMEAIS